MHFTHLFIRRPIMTTLVMAGILVFGIVGYLQLPVSDLPNVDFPTISVSATLPGASPDTMAASIATPLERQFTTIAGIDSMNSSSSLGSSQITLQFNLSRSIDSAAQDVQSAISTALPLLPANMPTPPTLRKVNPADAPILYIALSSKYLPLYQVDEYAENILAQEISMVSGVAQVSVYGSQKFAVRLQLDPKALATRNLAMADAVAAIQNGNVNLPIGALYGQQKTWTLQSDNAQLPKAAAFNPLVIAYRNGAPVHLRDIGTAKDTVENVLTASWFNNTRAIILAVQRQPGTNTIQVVQNIRRILPSFQKILPPAIHLDIMFDRSKTIQRSVNDVQFTLLITIALVILVIFLFLRSAFATLIASLALPMSIVGTFAFMALLGFNLDNLSLMALTLCVGFVVDDAIVMLENITRHMEMGKASLQAAFDGSTEIGFTIVSMTISLIAVFIPVLFMPGLIGRLFNEFAVTISIAILVSGFVSLTLTPMLCARFLRHQDLGKTNPILRFSERGLDAMTSFYQWTLQRALRFHPVVFGIFVLLLAGTVFMFGLVSKGFIPNDDIDQLSARTEAIQGISFQEMGRHQQRITKMLEKNKNIQSILSTVGSGQSASGNQGQLFLVLKPADKRRISSDKLLQTLRPKLARVPGIRVYLQNPPSIRIGGQSTNGLYQYTLTSENQAALYQGVNVLAKQLKTLPELQDVNTDLQLKNPELFVDIDRTRATALGITAAQVEQTLSAAYGTQQTSLIYAPTNTYQVIVELKPQYQQSADALSLLYVRSVAGQLVPLQSLVKFSHTVGPLAVTHLGQFASSTLSFNVRPGISLGEETSRIQAIANKILPKNVHGSFQGNAKMFQSSFGSTGLLLLLSVLVIYLVLGILYESFIHPLTILSGLPSAGLGALLTLWLFHKELDIYGFLGLIMLIGIVKKNAIMMIDFAIHLERSEHLPAAEAIYQACLVRFRPIMMTSLAALAGTFPIATGLGAGGSTRQSLGLAVFGGLLISQLLTLYITPVIYIYLDGLSTRLGRKKPRLLG